MSGALRSVKRERGERGKEGGRKREGVRERKREIERKRSNSTGNDFEVRTP